MKGAFVVVFCLLSQIGVAQKVVYKGFPSMVWPRLYDVTYVTYRDQLGESQKPVFPASVKAMENKSIVLPGYMVPLENATTSDRIILSSLPLNACFFCGVGGPETVVEVRLKTPTPYIEKPIEVKGFLRLNETDPDEMIYVLDNAEVLGTLE